ncbi:MAG: ABC transporter permease, partial [Phycisphaerae bacterium]|nr:ABC transporter permease [Phycisphaerae bacterium]
MQHWSQLATRNWRARPVRTLGAVAAIALGTGAVVWVTCCFESVRSSVLSWANQYVGRSHINIESPLGRDGTISELILKDVESLDGVAHVTPLLMRRLSGEALTIAAAEQTALEPRPWDRYVPKFDFYGIDVARESGVRDWKIVAGRMLREDDVFACVLEAAEAEERGVGLGDVLRVWGAAQTEPFEMKIVGLVDRRRIARFQQGLVLLPLRTLQQIDLQGGRVTALDVVAADESQKGVRKLRSLILTTLQGRPFGRNTSVSDTVARMRQIEMAQSQQELVLVMLSSVAMLTALFIILSTLSMGMIERISQLGLMRCIGVTGRQLAVLVAVEVAPLGVVGVLAGIPIGLGLAVFSVWLVPEYVGSFQVSWRGLMLAVVSGLATTAVAAVLPMIAALRVSPLEAAHPQARRPRRVWLWVSLALAAVLLAVQIYILETRVVRSPEFRNWAAGVVVLLYLSYACAAPLIVWLVGSPAVWIAARLLGVRARLLQDQVGHAVWRATGICCGLMVGLSLIVGLVVFSESFQSGWQFPKQFPEAYLWSIDQMREQTDDVDEVLANVGGVSSWAACNAANVYVTERPTLFARMYAALTWFVGCDPEQFFKVVRVEFTEGDQETALEQLAKGGYVIIADDFSRSRDKHLGDEVTVYFANRRFTFKVAAVVTSPALDIAAGYFQMHSQMQVAASGSVIGTNEDMKRLFGIRGRRLLLMNLDLPPEPVPENWPPPPNSADSV